jgi:hypothetical protein
MPGICEEPVISTFCMSVGLAAPVLAEWAGKMLGWLLITPMWLITNVWFVVVGIVA